MFYVHLYREKINILCCLNMMSQVRILGLVPKTGLYNIHLFYVYLNKLGYPFHTLVDYHIFRRYKTDYYLYLVCLLFCVHFLCSRNFFVNCFSANVLSDVLKIINHTTTGTLTYNCLSVLLSLYCNISQ